MIVLKIYNIELFIFLICVIGVELVIFRFYYKVIKPGLKKIKRFIGLIILRYENINW